jgi:hypothetical protein
MLLERGIDIEAKGRVLPYLAFSLKTTIKYIADHQLYFSILSLLVTIAVRKDTSLLCCRGRS